jgi:TonB family protein
MTHTLCLALVLLAAAPQFPVPSDVVALAAVKIALPSLPEGASPSEELDGPVAVRVRVSKQGAVTSAKALSGPKPMRKPAEAAATAWEFRPMTKGKDPTDVEATIYFVYSHAENRVYTQGPRGAYYGRPGAVLALAGGELPADAPEGAGLSRMPPERQPAADPAPQVVQGGVIAGKAIRQRQPVYPPGARARGIQGKVIVQVLVSTSGFVVWARPLAGPPDLGDAAVAAAREWRFSQTLLAGEPVPVVGTIDFNFFSTTR